MRIADARFERSQVCESKEGTQFLIPAGSVIGLAHVQRHVDPSRNAEEERGLFRVSFAFATADGRAWTYVALLNTRVLWPEGIQAKPASHKLSGSDRMINAVIDTRGWPEIVVDDGRTFQCAEKYNPVMIKAREQEDAVGVHLQCQVTQMVREFAESSVMDFEYAVPWAWLLFRRAPLVSQDDISPEDAVYSDIRFVGKVGERGVMPQLRPSAIVAC